MATKIAIAISITASGGGAHVGDHLLLEDGFHLLLEDGGQLLLES